MQVLIRRFLEATHDDREVVADEHAQYFGTELSDDSLVAAGDARRGSVRLDEWLSRSTRVAA